MKHVNLTQLTPIIQRRFTLLCQTGFIKTEEELKAILAGLSAIHFSDRFLNMNAILSSQSIEKEQAYFLNNLKEMFHSGEMFLRFFKYHAGVPKVDLAKAASIRRIINLVNNQDSSSFTRVYRQNKHYKKLHNPFKHKEKVSA